MTKKEKYSKVLEMFVSDDFFRVDMRNPFIQNGKYISTNAKILIHLPVDVIDLDYKNQSQPNCEKVLLYDKPFSRKISVQELKDVVETYSKKVPEYKFPPKDCHECNGDGYLECDLGHEHDCENCDGTGKTEGKEATGKMIPDESSMLGMLGSYIMIDKLQILFKACDILGVTNIEELSAGIDNKYTFKMGEFEVLIMGCFYNEEKTGETNLLK